MPHTFLDALAPPSLTKQVLTNQHFREAGEITGQPFDISETMREKIDGAGFTNVHERIYKNPMGSWPADRKLRELGRWTLLGFDVGLEGYVLATFTRVLKVSFSPVWMQQMLRP